MTDQTKNAIAFVQQALTDFANTLAPSVKGPFIQNAQQALNHIDAELTPKKPDADHG